MAVDEDPRSAPRRLLIAVVAVFVASLSLRITWVSLATVTPISHYAGYDTYARVFAQTGEIGFENKRAYHPPGYPAFLGTVYRLFGHDLRAAGYAHAVLGAITSALVALLAARCLPLPAAVVAGSLHALSLTALAYTPVLAVENLAVPLFVAVLVLLQPWTEPAWRRHVQLGAAGLVAGLLLLTRTAAIFALPAWLLLAAYHPAERRRRLLPALTFLLVLAATLAPWLVRNQRLGLGATLSTVGGVNLWMANNSLATNGDWLGRAQFETRMSEREQEQVYRTATLDWVRHHPARYAALCGVRAGRLLGMAPDGFLARVLVPTAAHDAAVLAEYRQNDGARVDEELARAGLLLIAGNDRLLLRLRRLSAPLALLALALAVPRWRRYAFLLLPLLAYWLGLGLTCMNERYREPSNALVYILLAALLTDMFAGTRALAGGRWVKAVLSALLVVIAVVASKQGLDAHLYRLKPLFAFRSVDPAAADVQVSPRGTARVVASAESPELRCAVKSRTDAEFGGVRWSAAGADALRLELTVPRPGLLEEVLVDGYDAGGARVVRWRWAAATTARLPAQRRTHVLVAGERYGYFESEACGNPRAAVEYHLLLRSKPKTRAEIILHKLERGTRRSAGP